MTDQGLIEVINPATIFLDRYGEAIAGSVVMVSRNGVRPFLVEVQALVSKTQNASRQLILGLEHNRLSLLLTIMKEHAKVDIIEHSVYVNIVGGLKITETASDLAVLLACVSSLKNQPLPHDMAVFGEVGLSGEIRSVPGAQERIKEAQKNGFKIVVVPKVNQPKQPIPSIKVIAVEYLYQVLQIIFESDFCLD